MSEVFTLEALQAELDRRYGPLPFEAAGEVFNLRPLLRCSKDERAEVVEALKELDSADENDLTEDDIVAAMKFVLSTVTANGEGKRLTNVLGDDLLSYQILFERWTERTQAGEA